MTPVPSNVIDPIGERWGRFLFPSEVFGSFRGFDFRKEGAKRMEHENVLIKKEKFEEMVALVPSEKQDVARGLLTEIAFMADMLDELRKTIREKGPTDLFKNGKQQMIRENPALKSYNTVVQRYGLLSKQYTDLLPKQQADAMQAALFEFMEEE